MKRLLPPELRDKALALTGDPGWTLGDWLARVIDNQPPGVDPAAWRRACAVKTLQAGPSPALGTAILMGLVDEVLADAAPLADRLELLEEAALLAPTFNYDSRQLAVELRSDTKRSANAWRGKASRDPTPQSDLRCWPRRFFPPLRCRRCPIPWSGTSCSISSRPSNGKTQSKSAAVRSSGTGLHAPGQRIFARESLGFLVEWARALALRNMAERPSGASAALRSEWRHPLVEVLSKEGYNILAEFNAALESEAYQDACQIISSADPQGALGLLPDAKDSRLLVSLPAAVSLAMREHPKLRQTMSEQFGRAAGCACARRLPKETCSRWKRPRCSFVQRKPPPKPISGWATDRWRPEISCTPSDSIARHRKVKSPPSSCSRGCDWPPPCSAARKADPWRRPWP